MEQRPTRPKRRRCNRRKMWAPGAPRNTSTFIIRMKSGGLASLVSPVTPAILRTPVISPAPRYREELFEEVNREWVVDGYGSMNGLIRLRSPERSDSGGGTADSETETKDTPAAEFEHRIDLGLSRFEIVYPSPSGGNGGGRPVREVRMSELESRIAHLEEESLDLESRIAHLEEEGLSLRTQWFALWEQELAESQRRLHHYGGGDHSCA